MLEHFNFVIFDYTGYGYSETDHCTLGLKEQQDLEAVVIHVREKLRFGQVYIWGRSMGAVAAVLEAGGSARGLSWILRSLLLKTW